MKYYFLIPIFILMTAFSSYGKATKNINSIDSIPIFLAGYEYEKVDGTSFSFEEVKGKVVLLNFWATWCKPCIKKHPQVVALAKKINHPDFQVINISINRTQSKWIDFIHKNEWPGINIRMDLLDEENPLNKIVTKKIIEDGRIVSRTTVPRYYLVDKDLSIEELSSIHSIKTRKLVKKKLQAEE